MLRYAWIFVPLFCAHPAGAQNGPALQLGGGLVPGIDQMGPGAGLTAAAHYLPGGSPFGLRVDAILALADYRYVAFPPGADPSSAEPEWYTSRRLPLAGAGLSLVASARHGAFRPYVFYGAAYHTHQRWGELFQHVPLFGFVGGAGVDTDVAGRRWFLEVQARGFGGFVDSQETRAIFPVTAGVRF